MSRTLIALLILVALLGPLPAQDGKLQRLREAVDQPGTPKPDKEKRDSDDREDDEEGNVFGEMFAAVVLAPFALPRAVLEEESHPKAYFPRHPYAHGRPGYLQLENLKEKEPGSLRTWAGRVALENGNDFDGLNRTSGHLFLESTSRFGIQARYEYLHERLACGCHDESHLASTELTYRFAQSPHVQMYAGAGLRVLDDVRKTHYGVNFTYGADIFPARPFVISLSVDGGTLGDAGVFRARGTAGVLYRGLELFSGYDFLKVGSIEIQGLLAGLRLWF